MIFDIIDLARIEISEEVRNTKAADWESQLIPLNSKRCS